MPRPARVRIRRRKPWVRLRRRLLGWKVRLVTGKLPYSSRSARTEHVLGLTSVFGRDTRVVACSATSQHYAGHRIGSNRVGAGLPRLRTRCPANTPRRARNLGLRVAVHCDRLLVSRVGFFCCEFRQFRPSVADHLPSSESDLYRPFRCPQIYTQLWITMWSTSSGSPVPGQRRSDLAVTWTVWNL